uniref:Uncharacterized protein n=1 Tax=Davidia involucrata TaxID=16924 RepID=A0A5B7C6R6_DAVIN
MVPLLAEMVPHQTLSCSCVNVSRAPGNWHSELQWAMDHLKGDSFQITIQKLALSASASIYHIWSERNARIMKAKTKPAVAATLASWRGIKNTCENWILSLNFGVCNCIFLPSN